jgi:hypothetical protein
MSSASSTAIITRYFVGRWCGRRVGSEGEGVRAGDEERGDEGGEVTKTGDEERGAEERVFGIVLGIGGLDIGTVLNTGGMVFVD